MFGAVQHRRIELPTPQPKVPLATNLEGGIVLADVFGPLGHHWHFALETLGTFGSDRLQDVLAQVSSVQDGNFCALGPVVVAQVGMFVTAVLLTWTPITLDPCRKSIKLWGTLWGIKIWHSWLILEEIFLDISRGPRGPFGQSRMSGRRTSGTSRSSLGVQVLAVFSFKLFPRESRSSKMSGKTPGSSRHPSSRHPRPSDPCGICGS